MMHDPTGHMLTTMVTKDRQIAAGEFTAKCLALLDDVAQTGRPIVVSKRGKAVARVVPMEGQEELNLAGSVLEEHDLVSPVDLRWDA